ncbi:MAG: F0F1 ATP synthase subunit alpha, partial [Cyanobacteria bacterium PR.023]|nr:F0F1 ATP synthase subunit alpha [Cyanobacteria bacterium PR.023]
LALIAGLFDAIAIARMTEAQQIVQQSAAKIPADVIDRLLHAKNLSTEDRAAIVQIAGQALADFKS